MAFQYRLFIVKYNYYMKRYLPFILITAFLFPVLSHAATAVTQTGAVQTAAVAPIDLNSPQIKDLTLVQKQKTVSKGLADIYTQLNSLSGQAQLAETQIDANGLDTTKAQTDLLAANTSLDKAKLAIATFSGISIPKTYSSFTLDTLKYNANIAENDLRDAKAHLIDSLADLKALLPVLDTTDQS